MARNKPVKTPKGKAAPEPARPPRAAGRKPAGPPAGPPAPPFDRSANGGARAGLKAAAKYADRPKPGKQRQGVTFIPTPDQCRTVEAMAGYGMPQIQIADALLISDETLRKYFAREIRSGIAKANSQVAQSLHRLAAGSPAQYDAAGKLIRAEQPPDPRTAQFWARTRLGFRDVRATELSGPGGKPVQFANLDPAKLTDAELEQVERILVKAGAELGTGEDQGREDKTRH